MSNNVILTINGQTQQIDCSYEVNGQTQFTRKYDGSCLNGKQFKQYVSYVVGGLEFDVDCIVNANKTNICIKSFAAIFNGKKYKTIYNLPRYLKQYDFKDYEWVYTDTRLN